jgi:hypothetical protein
MRNDPLLHRTPVIKVSCCCIPGKAFRALCRFCVYRAGSLRRESQALKFRAACYSPFGGRVACPLTHRESRSTSARLSKMLSLVFVLHGIATSDATIISGEFREHVEFADRLLVIVQNAVFLDCYSPNSGGAICAKSPSLETNLTLSDCKFRNCKSERGGAIFFSGRTAWISDCWAFQCWAVNSGQFCDCSLRFEEQYELSILSCAILDCSPSLLGRFGSIALDSGIQTCKHTNATRNQLSHSFSFLYSLTAFSLFVKDCQICQNGEG